MKSNTDSSLLVSESDPSPGLMSLRWLSDQDLHDDTVQIAQDEREKTQKILLHLREVERRKLYLKHRLDSLHSYCTAVLKYSEGSASRRVNASRLLGDLPEIAEKVLKGQVNLSNLSMAQSFIRADERSSGQQMPLEMKREILERIESVTQDQAARALVELLPNVHLSRDRIRPLPEGRYGNQDNRWNPRLYPCEQNR